MDDWYALQVKDFSQRMAEPLISRYNNSPFELLTKVSYLLLSFTIYCCSLFICFFDSVKLYPEHPWDPVEYVKYVYCHGNIFFSNTNSRVQKKLANSPTIMDDPYHRKKLAYAKPFQDDLRGFVQEVFPNEGTRGQNIKRS